MRRAAGPRLINFSIRSIGIFRSILNKSKSAASRSEIPPGDRIFPEYTASFLRDSPFRKAFSTAKYSLGSSQARRAAAKFRKSVVSHAKPTYRATGLQKASASLLSSRRPAESPAGMPAFGTAESSSRGDVPPGEEFLADNYVLCKRVFNCPRNVYKQSGTRTRLEIPRLGYR